MNVRYFSEDKPNEDYHERSREFIHGMPMNGLTDVQVKDYMSRLQQNKKTDIRLGIKKPQERS